MRLTLDESLFDDDMKLTFDEPAIAVFDEDHFDLYKDDLDDDTFIYEPLAKAKVLADHTGEAIPEGPESGLDSGIASSLISLINDEWEAIQGYNDFRAMIQQMAENNEANYTNMLTVIDEIVNEENLHVGQLQELLKTISPNAESIADGEEEAKEQLESSSNEWVNGQLKVQFHEPKVAEKMNINSGNPNEVDTTCTLCDADDEW